MNQPHNPSSAFGSYLQSNLSIDSSTIDGMVSHCRRIAIPRGDFALRAGALCHHIFFVERGLLKEYSIDPKGKEHILLFAPENWFAANVETVFFHTPSNFFIEAIEDSSILLLDRDTINLLSKTYDAFSDFYRQLIQAQIRELELRVSQLLGATAEERYLDFMQRFPQLHQRLPQIEIAAYLGITPESLSRVRKELALRHCKPKA